MIRVRSAVVLVAGLCAVAGCSSGEGKPAAQPPKAELVAWSQTVCGGLSTIGDLKDEYADLRDYGAATYAGYVRTDVQSVLDDLGALKPAPVARAEDFVTSLRRELRSFRDELPEQGTGKAPGVERIDERADTIAGRAPELTALARRSRALAPSYHLAPACDALKPAPELATPATRQLVGWANATCEIRDAVANAPAPNYALAKDPRFAPHASYVLQDYLDTIAPLATSSEATATSLPRTNVGKADALASELRSTLGDLRRRAGADDRTPSYDRTIGEVRLRVEQTTDTVGKLTGETDRLASVTSGHRGLRAATELAPECGEATPEPEKALPEAEDGSDVGACGDGTCEVRVGKPVDVTIGSNTFTLTVTGASLWIVSGSGFMQLGSPARGQYGVGGETFLFAMDDSTDDAGIVRISRG